MNDHWVQAYLSIQEKYEKMRKNQSLNNYLIERFDGALDYLVRNPHLSGDPTDLGWRAWRAAGKKLRREKNRRIQFIGPEAIEQDNSRVPAEAVEDPLYGVVILHDFINSAQLPAAEIQILRELSSWRNPGAIAQRLGITVSQARVRISRTRRKAWAQWLAA